MTAPDALDEGTELFQTLFGHSPLAVAVLDRELVLRAFNRAFADSVRRTGTPDAGPVRTGRSLHEFFPAIRPRTQDMFAAALAGESRWHRGVPHETRGVITYWDLLLVPLRRDGEVVGVVEVFTDATERTETERNERRFRSILRNLTDIVAVVDAEGAVRLTAPSARRLLDLPGDVSTGYDVTAPVHPDDREAVREAITRCAERTGGHVAFRCRLRHIDGTWHPFEGTAVNLLDDSDVAGIVLNARDVTERERATEELRRRDAILETVRAAAQLFLESQSSWRANIDEVLALLGTAASVSRVYIFENFATPNGTTMTIRSHEWVASGVQPKISNAQPNSIDQFESAGPSGIVHRLSSGEAVAADVSSLPKDERAVLTAHGIKSLALVPVFVSGQWWGMIGFDECQRERDWSAAEIDALRAAASTLSAAVQRQRAEDELREQQAEYRHMFDATGDGLVITDLDGRLVRANPAFYRMHGYQPDELIGRGARTWVHSDFHNTRDHYIESVLNGARPRIDAVDVRKNGSTFPVQVHGSMFTFQGRPHVLGVVRDDTERAQAFDLLERRISALASVAASLTVSRPLPDTMESIARTVVSATPAVACSVYVQDPESGRPRVLANTGLPPGYAEAVELSWRAEPSVPDHLSPPGHPTEPVIVRDAVRRALRTPSRAPLHALLEQVSWDTVVVTPLESQGRRLGSVNAYYPKDIEPVADEITFLRAVADQCTVAVDNARLLAEAANKAGVEERQRLSRELHDSVSQALYGIALGARTAKALAGQAPEQLAEPLDYVLSLAQAAMAEMRSLIFELRPESLAQEGLVAALERRVTVLRTRHRLRVAVSLGVEPQVPLALKETLYRIAQEAMHNSVKHARAQEVRLTLRALDHHIELDVADDGVGFDTAGSRPGHLGLQSMRERAAAHRGSFDLVSRPGAGTLIRVQLPVPSGTRRTGAPSEPVPGPPA